MTIQQVVRDILERAVEDGLVEPRGPNADDPQPDPDPQRFTDEDLAGCTGLLAAWLRRRGAHGAARDALWRQP
jgi:hypothetical protein